MQEIVRTDTESATYSHDYAVTKEYTIGIGGRATGYNTNNAIGPVSNLPEVVEECAVCFSKNKNVAGIKGSLGAVFSTVGEGIGTSQQPRFVGLFWECDNLKGSIPENLFTGIYGTPVDSMFKAIFLSCSGLTGSIPEDLFAGIDASLAPGVFWLTFYDCSGLTGSSAKINGKYLYEIWPDAAAGQVDGCYKGATGLSDYASIPAVWK